jgi:HEAT repeat protein
MSDFNPATKPAPPGDALPPVEPPSAAFLVQLFLIPGLIVGVIVLVWVLFNWIAHSGSGDPRDYVEALRRNSPDVWVKAEILAEMLGNDRRNELRSNSELAGELADILDQRIADGQMDKDSVNLRVYLSKALGQFNTPTALPALLKAATTNRDEAEMPVRRAALDAIGALAVNVQTAEAVKAEVKKADAGAGSTSAGSTSTSAGLSDPELMKTLLAASHDQESVIRLRAAYVLGIVGGPQAIDRLAQMLDDPYPDVAYNAATGLARHGDARSIDMLAAMLAIDENAATLESEQKDLREGKRWAIIINALRAVGQLAEANPTADLSRVEPAVRAWQKPDAKAASSTTDVPLEVREAALAAGEAIQNRTSPAHR